MGYKVINYIKCLKGYRAPCGCIYDINSRNNRREPRSCKLEKGNETKKDFLSKTEK